MGALEDMLADRTQWPLILEMIRSDQMSSARISQINRDHPEFVEWWKQQIRAGK